MRYEKFKVEVKLLDYVVFNKLINLLYNSTIFNDELNAVIVL